MPDPKSSINYYEILEISENATRKEIVEAYQRAKAVYSKDSMALYSLYSDEESNNMVNLIEEAYQVLINPQRRDLYNREHNINSHRAVVNIIFDKPGELGRSFVETPNFGDTSDDYEDPKINKAAFKAYVSVSKQESASKVPEYKLDESFESKIRFEEEFSGVFLQQIRKYKNMNLGYLSNVTKVAVYHLEAIEREDYKAMPARVYVRGFIKSYAKALDLDFEKVVDAYMKRYDKALEK